MNGNQIEVDVRELVKLGKLLKKNNVAVDVIIFGDEPLVNSNEEKLKELVAAANNDDNRFVYSLPEPSRVF